MVYTLRNVGTHAEYKAEFLRQAVEDICEFAPNGVADYHEQIRVFATGLYDKLSRPGTRYFIDKTPPYSLGVSEIINIFPNAKFIFLWRNPLAVAASVMKSWANGRFNLFRVEPELYVGLPNLIAAYAADRARYHSLNYESLCAAPEEEMARVHAFLDLPFDPQQIMQLNTVQLRGRLGDRGEMCNSPAIDTVRSSHWAATMSNPLRKNWCRKYLNWLGEDRLRTIGYDIDIIRADLDAAPSNFKLLGSDSARMIYGQLNRWLEIELIAQNWRAARAARK